MSYVSGTFGESASDRHTTERSTLLTDDMFSQSWQVWKLWPNIYVSKDVKGIGALSHPGTRPPVLWTGKLQGWTGIPVQQLVVDG